MFRMSRKGSRLGEDDVNNAGSGEKAGVSKATVSRVLSGKGYVSEETRKQVFAAIEAAGYRPNLLARNPATSKSQCIGMVVTNTLYSGSYFSEILSRAAKKWKKAADN